MVAPLLLGWLLAQTVKPPRPVHRPEPSYSDEARQAGVQGNVLVHLTVDEHGKPRDIEILSPLGFGLDERAIRAIEQWRFEPARQNGQPVSMEAQIEVSFRFQDAWFDRKQEELRQAYNATVAQLSKSGLEEKRQAALIKSLETLSGKKYPPAQAALGSFLLRGQYGLAPDPVRGDELIRQAAKKHNGPALADWGQLRIQQGALEEGLALLRDAAVHGAESAQYVLGRRYETGDGVPRELDRARQGLGRAIDHLGVTKGRLRRALKAMRG
mgnify:CR=1 FL=1